MDLLDQTDALVYRLSSSFSPSRLLSFPVPDLQTLTSIWHHESAAAGEDCPTAQELLSAGADAERPNSAGVTPLIGAAFFGHAPVVSALLARGANARAHDRVQRRSSLHWAAMNDHMQVSAHSAFFPSGC